MYDRHFCTAQSFEAMLMIVDMISSLVGSYCTGMSLNAGA